VVLVRGEGTGMGHKFTSKLVSPALQFRVGYHGNIFIGKRGREFTQPLATPWIGIEVEKDDVGPGTRSGTLEVADKSGMSESVDAEEQIRRVIGEYWQTVDAGDYEGVREYAKGNSLEKAERWLTIFNKERKRLLSRGIDIAQIEKVMVNGNEALALAIGQVTKGRPVWYYLRRDDGKWFIRTFFDSAADEIIDRIFYHARVQSGVKVEAEEEIIGSTTEAEKRGSRRDRPYNF
jgi:hypothetical protein